MLYSHVTLLMLRVVDVVAKTTVQQSARMLVAEIPGDIQVRSNYKKKTVQGILRIDKSRNLKHFPSIQKNV